jgi:hypothetical protein
VIALSPEFEALERGRAADGVRGRGRLWPAATLAEQPLLVVREVLGGHIDLLNDAGQIAEHVGDDGQARLELVRARATPR